MRGGLIMRLLGYAAAAAVVSLASWCQAAPAHAAPVDVSYTVSGSAGNWLLDFSVTNNLGNTNDLYIFGVQLPAHNPVGDPEPQFSAFNSNWSNAAYGGSSIDYNNNWISNNPALVNIAPGQTLSGFQATVTDLSAPSTVNWFALALFGTDDGNCGFNCVLTPQSPTWNPGFEGSAVVAVAATPVPATLPLLASALGGLGWIGWRRKRAA
jgi:hypothetical protein